MAVNKKLIQENQVEEKKEEKSIIEQKQESKVVPFRGAVVGGLENLDAQDITIPRVRLLQATSREVQRGEAKVGTFQNSLTGENYGSKLEFIPFQVFKSRVRFSQKTALCISRDAITGIGDPGGDCETCSFSQWGSEREAPECSLVYNYLSWLPGRDEELPIAVSLMRTSIPTARKFNTILRFDRKGAAYELYPEQKENEKGMFFIFNIRRLRGLTPEEMQKVIELRKLFAGRVVEVEQTPDEFEEEELPF